MTGHMAEHLALTLLVAPALALFLAALRPLRFLPRRAARALYVATWPPLGWVAFVGVQWVTHFTGIYEASLHSEWVHEAEHAAFLLSALLFWWAVLGADHRLGAIGRGAYVLTAMPAMSLVGVILATDGKPRYPSYSLQDEHAAGALMWSVGSLAMAAALVVSVWTWLQREERRALALAALVLVPAASAQSGRQLFVEGCASCHGMDARGIAGRGPNLHGAGAGAADFYLRTGRMPLESPHAQPVRADPLYPDADIKALVRYVGSLGGPPVPRPPDPARGSLSAGYTLFREHCAGCHQIAAEGGAVVVAVAPDLKDATPTQIAEAVRTGPYVMPEFPRSQISDRQLDSLVAYIDRTKDPVDRGGWGLRHLGPIPEGLVVWLLAGTVLVLVARAIGERAP